MTEPLSDAAAQWALRINSAWKSSVEGIIDAGRILAEAKAALEHGEFIAMIERELPFGRRMANMLMQISSDERLSNENVRSHLPPSWTVLRDLTRLSDTAFEKHIQEGKIRPDMRGSDIVREPIVRPNWEPAPPHEALALVIQDLVTRRQAMGISQIELDERIGWSVGLAGKFEANIRRPTAQVLAEWAQALGGYITFMVGPLPSPALHKAESQLRIGTPI